MKPFYSAFLIAIVLVGTLVLFMTLAPAWVQYWTLGAALYLGASVIVALGIMDFRGD